MHHSRIVPRGILLHHTSVFRPPGIIIWSVRFALVVSLLGGAGTARAGILWSDLGATHVENTGVGVDILGGTLKRDDSSSDTLYFKFHVDPSSDVRTEEYFAAFQLFFGDT